MVYQTLVVEVGEIEVVPHSGSLQNDSASRMSNHVRPTFNKVLMDESIAVYCDNC
jgi:hypothetical protein